MSQKNLKEEALKIISSLPENAVIEDIMYRLYVLDKIHKGQKAVIDGQTLSSEELKAQIDSW